MEHIIGMAPDMHPEEALARHIDSRWLLFVLLAVTAAACSAPAPRAASQSTEAAPPVAHAPKRIVFASPYAIDIRPTGAVSTRQTVLPLVASGFSSRDGQGNHVSLLAEKIPSIENGLWTLRDDGTMQTTFQVRAGARWHDGTPITADDFLFSLQIGRDGVVPAFSNAAYASITAIETSGPHTLIVTWREPYNAADALFSWDQSYGAPLPRHLLADPYAANKDGFLDLPYWGQEYVGSGPYKVESWEPGVGMQLVAHDGYALGRPKLDRIDVQIIPDANTVIAGLLAGSIDATPTVGSMDAAKQLGEQWQGGSVIINLGQGTVTIMVPQFVDPTPTAIGDLRLRTALAVGTDRQAIVEQIALGTSPVPLSFLNAGQPQYAALEATLPSYAYDPQRARELLGEMGYVRGSDGMLRDAAAQPLSLEVRSSVGTGAEQLARAATAIASDWQQVGVAAAPARVAAERVTDLTYIASFPSFFITARPSDVEGLSAYTSSHSMLSRNNYRAPSPNNYARYMNADADQLIASYFRAIPRDERVDVMGQIVHLLTEQLTYLGLWYNANPGAHSNRLTGVGPRWANANFAWNSYAWDVSN